MGQIDLQELHRELGFPIGAKCKGCGGPPAITLRSFAEEAEMLKRDHRLKILAMENTEAYRQMRLRNRHGVFLRINEVYACSVCAPGAEKAAAKHPDWVVVIIDRGPEANKPTVGWRK